MVNEWGMSQGIRRHSYRAPPTKVPTTILRGNIREIFGDGFAQSQPQRPKEGPNSYSNQELRMKLAFSTDDCQARGNSIIKAMEPIIFPSNTHAAGTLHKARLILSLVNQHQRFSLHWKRQMSMTITA